MKPWMYQVGWALAAAEDAHVIGEDSCGTPSADALVAPIVKRCGSAAAEDA